MVKAKTLFQADLVSQDAVRFFAKDSEMQADGAETAEQLQPDTGSSCTFYKELDVMVE